MTPMPKRGKLDYPPYIKWIKTLPCCETSDKNIDPAHQRQLHGGGTGMKPPDFHALPVSKRLHDKEHGINGGYQFDRNTAAARCLSHIVGYLMLKASLHQQTQVLDMVGTYIKEEKI